MGSNLHLDWKNVCSNFSWNNQYDNDNGVQICLEIINNDNDNDDNNENTNLI